MKKIILLALMGCSLSGCITTIKLFEKDGKLMGVLPLVNGKVVYQERVNTPELPKEEVFRRARRWWVDNYRSAKDVFQLVDKETGEIVGKGNGKLTIRLSKASVPRTYRIYHVISFDVAEDYYVAKVYGLEIENGDLRGLAALSAVEFPVEQYNVGTVKSVTATFREIDEQTRLTLQSLHRYIQKPGS